MRKIIATTVLLSTFLISCVPQPKLTGWVSMQTSDSPPPLLHSGFAYDTNSNEAVVFGGVTVDKWSDETWIWDGGNWLKASSPTGPSAREKLAMAYDEARDRIILFGGAMNKTIYDDTWEWNGSSWQQMSPTHSPPARCCHAMAYDSVQNKVLLYGGWNHVTGEFYNDSWEWDGKDWAEVTCCNIPLSAAHTLVNFSDESKVIAVPSSESVNTWSWDGTNWSEIPVRPNPSRADGRSAYYGKDKQIVFFGGIANSTLLSDTWVFDGQEWNLLNLPAQPPARYGHVMFYDTRRQSIILFGGAGSEMLFGDTWELVLPEVLSIPVSGTTLTP